MLCIIDYTAALAFAAANDDLTVKDVGIESDSEGQCIGVQKGNEDFVAYLNEKIAEMPGAGPHRPVRRRSPNAGGHRVKPVPLA